VPSAKVQLTFHTHAAFSVAVLPGTTGSRLYHGPMSIASFAVARVYRSPPSLSPITHTSASADSPANR
jgi:hypothetical protein